MGGVLGKGTAMEFLWEVECQTRVIGLDEGVVVFLGEAFVGFGLGQEHVLLVFGFKDPLVLIPAIHKKYEL